MFAGHPAGFVFHKTGIRYQSAIEAVCMTRTLAKLADIRYTIPESSTLYIQTQPIPVCGFVLAKLALKAWKVQPLNAGVNHRLLIMPSTVRLTYAGQPSNASESITRNLFLPLRFMMLQVLLQTFMLRLGIKVESGMESGHILCDNDPNSPHITNPNIAYLSLIFSTPNHGMSWPAIETVKKHSHPIVLVSRRLPRSMPGIQLRNVFKFLLITSRGAPRYDVTVIPVGVSRTSTPT